MEEPKQTPNITSNAVQNGHQDLTLETSVKENMPLRMTVDSDLDSDGCDEIQPYRPKRKLLKKALDSD